MPNIPQSPDIPFAPLAMPGKHYAPHDSFTPAVTVIESESEAAQIISHGQPVIFLGDIHYSERGHMLYTCASIEVYDSSYFVLPVDEKAPFVERIEVEVIRGT